jgi:Rieske Fe-S protein
MTAEPQKSQCATRRGVLLGAGLAGLGAVLAGCSTAAVPYDANEAGVVEHSGPAASAMATAAAPMPASATPASATPASPMPASPMPAGTRPASPGPASPGRRPARGGKATTEPSPAGKGTMGAQATGTVLGTAGEIPVGGGKIFTAAKVVVTQPVRGQYLGFSAVCTHAGCILSEVVNGAIDCPCHGSQFTITNGDVITGPAPRPLPKKQVMIVNGQVVLVLS